MGHLHGVEGLRCSAVEGRGQPRRSWVGMGYFYRVVMLVLPFHLSTCTCTHFIGVR